MDTKPDYVPDVDPQPAAEGPGLAPVVLERIKQALVTSRLTLAGQSVGADPYNSRTDRRRSSVWGRRSR